MVLNLKPGTTGELFGYGYLNLPLTGAKPNTGNNSWTLFLNTANFKGPVAFFTPHFWASAASKEARLAGQLLETRPSDPNRQVQMETQYIPCRVATDGKGESYARISPTSYPRSFASLSALVHRDTVYTKDALWNSVEAWFAGGPAPTGAINSHGSHVRTFPGQGYSTWEIRMPGPDGKEVKTPIDWPSFASPVVVDAQTFGLRWKQESVAQRGKLVTIPETFHLDRKLNKWLSLAPELVPAETGLNDIRWTRPNELAPEPYVTPTQGSSSWRKPGPVAGPFKVKLGDGSVVTYYWYRFADQPALLNAGLSDAEREEMQAKVVKIHRAWPKNRNYLAPPTVGSLASLDPALIVKPPKGLEYGYVPIATRQEISY